MDSIGDAVREALDNWAIQNLYYDDIKKNPESFIEELITQLEDRHLIIDKDSTRKNLRKALELAIKIADKMPPDFRDPEKVHAVSKAISGAADDPFHILKQAGIDIEPELEEFRQFLAEISGKKIESQEPHPKTETAGELSSASSSLTLAARELLGTLKGLKLAGYTDVAVDGLRAELNGKIEALMENPAENLELIGLYAAVLKLAEKGEIEKAEEFLRGL